MATVLSGIYRRVETLRPGRASVLKLSAAASRELARLSFVDEGPALTPGTELTNYKVLDAWNEGNWEVYHITFGVAGKAPNDVAVDLGINSTEGIKGATIGKLAHDAITVLLDGNRITTLESVIGDNVLTRGQLSLRL